MAVIGSVLGRAGEQGQKRRMEDAKNGKVTWDTPSEIKQFIETQQKRARWAKRAAQEEAAANDTSGGLDGSTPPKSSDRSHGRTPSTNKDGTPIFHADEAMAELQMEVDAVNAEDDVNPQLRNISRRTD